MNEQQVSDESYIVEAAPENNCEETEVSEPADIKPLRRGKWYQQAFKKKWLLHPQLRDWLLPSNSTRFEVFCTYCNCNLKNPNKTALLAHGKTIKHLKCAKKLGHDVPTTIVTKGRRSSIRVHDDSDHEASHHYYSDPTTPVSVVISDPDYCSPTKTKFRHKQVRYEPQYVEAPPPPPRQVKQEKEEEGCEAFAKYVSSQLKKMPVKEMFEAQCDIQHMLIQKRLSIINSATESGEASIDHAVADPSSANMQEAHKIMI